MSYRDPEYIVKLKKFANEAWPNMRLGHSIWGVDTKYPCANPEGPVDNSNCPDNDPLCECPCQELKPDSDEQIDRINEELGNVKEELEFVGEEPSQGQGPFFNPGGEDGEGLYQWSGENVVTKEDLKEPTDEELRELLEQIRECDLIESELGSEWLGCLWTDQENPSSCNCPCVGEKFSDYLEYTRTSATYWDTPKNIGMWRNAQMILLNAQKCVIVVDGDFSLQPGRVISIYAGDPKAESADETGDWDEHRIGGRWLVHGIEHVVSPTTHRMFVVLMRDSCRMDPKEGTTKSWFQRVFGS